MTGIAEAIAISAAVSLATAGITYALTPTQQIAGQRLQDLTTAKSNYGASLPWCWGKVRVGGNVIWSTFKEEKKKKQKQGKGAKVETENFTYYGSFATAFCECPFRPLEDISRVWMNKKLTFSKVGGAETIASGGKFADRYLRFYYGQQFQEIDPLLENVEPISNFNYGIPSGKNERAAFFQSLGLNQNELITTPGYNRRAYLVAQRMPLEDFFNRLPTIEAELVASNNCSVGQILGDIFGLFFEPEKYDVSLLNDIAVEGFFLNSIAAAKNAVQSLQQAYFFDIIQSGGKIKFLPINRARNIINLSSQDLAAHSGQTQKPTDYSIVEEDITKLPSSVKVTYIDPDLNYDQNEQSSNLEVRSIYNENIVTLSLNIVMDSNEAVNIADRAMFLAWLQNRKYKFSLPPAYLDLEAGDLLNNVFDDSGNPVKLTQVRIGADFRVDCEAIPYDPSFFNLVRTLESGSVTVGIADYSVAIATQGTPIAVADTNGNTYTQGTDYRVNGNSIEIIESGNIAQGTDLLVSTAVTPTQSNQELGTILNPGDTELLVLDIPLIKNSEEDFTTYLTAGGGDNWSGASIYFSVDNSRYIFATTIDTYGIYGTCLELTEQAIVRVNKSELESITNNDLTLGLNLALIGNEIIQFKTAQLIDVDTYLLSELTRGLRGTEFAITSHGDGERFVLLTGTNAEIVKITASETDMGQIRYFKALSSGQTLGEVEPVQILYQGIAQRPYAPVNLSATKNAVGDITISWDRRDRHDQSENPLLSETTEEYQVSIINSDTVTRVGSSYSNTYIYTKENQQSDFGSLVPTITVKIAQVSSVFGVGSYTSETELTPILVEPKPTITGFAPASSKVGETIALGGTNLASVSNVKIGDVVQANLQIIDNQNITFDITIGTVSGIIELTTPGGTAVSSNALIIEQQPRTLVFPVAENKILPYTITPDDAGKELVIEAQTEILAIPNSNDGFYSGWGCWISLDGSGTITIRRPDSNNQTYQIIGNNIVADNQTVKLWHRGNNVWKID